MDPYPVLDAKALGLDGILGNAINIMNQQQAGWMGQMQQDYEQLAGQRDQAFHEVQQSAQQPAAQLDPRQEFWSRLAGGLSQALSPNMQGQQLAETGLDRQRMELQQKQLRAHQILATKYEQAARAAEKAGDNMTSLKMWKNHQGALELIRTAGDQLNNMRTNAARIREAQIQASAKQGDKQGDIIAAQYTAAVGAADNEEQAAREFTKIAMGEKDKKKAKQALAIARNKSMYAQAIRAAADAQRTSGKWTGLPENPAVASIGNKLLPKLADYTSLDDAIADINKPSRWLQDLLDMHGVMKEDLAIWMMQHATANQFTPPPPAEDAVQGPDPRLRMYMQQAFGSQAMSTRGPLR